MKNMTATGCWTILRSECYWNVPKKNQGKRSEKKQICQQRLSERLGINKICGGFINIRERIKITKFTKKVLNEATNEVRKSKRIFEHRLAQNIKPDNKSFYAYVRSKQNVRDKVGPMEDNAGNIITQGSIAGVCML